MEAVAREGDCDMEAGQLPCDDVRDAASGSCREALWDCTGSSASPVGMGEFSSSS
jgi:hypothetical protein